MRRAFEEIVGDHDLVEGLLVHEGVAAGLMEEERAFVLVDMHFLDGLGGAEALLQLVALGQRLGFELHESTALAGIDVLDLGRHPELVLVLDDIADADRVDWHFHGEPVFAWVWHSKSAPAAAPSVQPQSARKLANECATSNGRSRLQNQRSGRCRQ
jgi:hypothetical protein